MKFDYGRYRQELRLARITRFDPDKHPRGPDGKFRVIGYHGETRGSIEGEFNKPTMFVGLDRDLAYEYAEGGRVHDIEFDANNPLVLDTPEKVELAWDESKALDKPGRFHPDKTEAFAEWARSHGHDAVVIPQSAFEGDLGYEISTGTWGEPQALLLRPDKVVVK